MDYPSKVHGLIIHGQSIDNHGLSMGNLIIHGGPEGRQIGGGVWEGPPSLLGEPPPCRGSPRMGFQGPLSAPSLSSKGPNIPVDRGVCNGPAVYAGRACLGHQVARVCRASRSGTSRQDFFQLTQQARGASLPDAMRPSVPFFSELFVHR